MNKFLIIVWLGLFCQQATLAQGRLAEASPESQHISAERLGRIDKVMKEYIEQGKMNGAAYLVARNGKIILYRAVGYNDRENNTPLKRDDIFRIASQTKAITSVAVMMLYEEGKFLLDDPVSKYIHSFKNPQVLHSFNAADTTYTTVPAKREVTIRDLLNHTSGIGYAQVGSPESIAIYAKNRISAGLGTVRTSLAEDIQRLGSLPLLHNPGERWTYGLNTDVLGYLVEILSGMSLDKFLRTRIFEPLGMQDTYFYLPAGKQNRLVIPYMPDSTGKLVKAPAVLRVHGPIRTNYPQYDGSYYSGGAGLSSTLYDYAIFLQMLLNGGTYNGQRILARNTVRMMTMNQIGELSLGDNKFGLGFEVVSEAGSALTPVPEKAFSWGGAFATAYWADPKEKIIGLFYKQLWNDPTPEAAEKFKVMVYSALTD